MRIIASALVFFAILFSASSVEAKVKHHVSHGVSQHITDATPVHHHHFRHYSHHSGSVSVAYGSGGNLVAAMESHLGGNPTGWSHQWCAHYLGMMLHSVGLPDSGSNTAISYAHYGRPASPTPGVIAVMRHHVGVVTKVLGGDKVELVSGNHSHRVGIGVYSTQRIIAWRTAG